MLVIITYKYFHSTTLNIKQIKKKHFYLFYYEHMPNFA